MKKLFLLLLLALPVLCAGCQQADDPTLTQTEPITYEGDGPWIIQTKYPTDDVVIADVVVTPEKYDVDPTGEKDSTMGIQKAINDARKADGGTVWLPAGKYRISRGITIPAFVTLRGDWQDPDTGNEYGTILLMDIPTVGQFDNTGTIYVSGSAGVMGLTIYYPNQSLDDIKAYPFTFYVNGLGDGFMLQNIINCTLINSYKGIGACVGEGGPHEMMTIENVKGTVLSLGAEAYNQCDVGTWKNLTFSPEYWANAPLEFNPPELSTLQAYTKENTIGLRLGDLEWTQFAHIRLSHFKTGVHVVTGKRIQFAGSMYDLQVTDCDTAFLADDMDNRWGAVIANSTLSGERALINNSGGQVRLAGVTLEGVQSGDILVEEVSSHMFAEVTNKVPQKPTENLKVVQADKSGMTDISADLQNVLDSLASTGGIAYLPAGLYRLEKPVTVPAGVELRGASSVAQREQGSNSNGTLILVYPEDHGSLLEADKAQAMVTLSGDHSGIRGVRFLYPDNISAAAKSLPTMQFAYTIRGTGTGVYAINVAVTGGTYGIDFRSCDNHIIKRFVGSCIVTAMHVGGKNGVIEGCLQNGNSFCRMGVSSRFVIPVPETDVFTLVFDPILRQTATYICVEESAVGEVIFNTFAYGVKTFVSSGGNVSIFNVGADNIGSDAPMVDAWGGNIQVVNMMRYNGFSYSCENANLQIFNRLTIGHKESESQSVKEQN